MPVSAARHLKLPENLINLNRSLQSMVGEQTCRSEASADTDPESGLRRGGFCGRVESDPGVRRKLEQGDHRRTAGPHARAYGHGRYRRVVRRSGRAEYWISGSTSPLLDLRREASSGAIPPGDARLQQLITAGKSLDTELRSYVANVAEAAAEYQVEYLRRSRTSSRQRQPRQ